MVASSRYWLAVVTLAVWSAGCPDPASPADVDVVAPDGGDVGSDAEVGSDADAGPDVPPPEMATVQVTVTLDDVPTADVMVIQGGTASVWRTGADGTFEATVDLTLDGDIALVASHPDARTRAELIYPSSVPAALTIALTRFDPTDNVDYAFEDPGEPGNSPTTGQCGHCHVTINEAWYGSEHRRAASNPRLFDIYTGQASALADPTACADGLGTWAPGAVGGSDATEDACYVGPSALADINGCAPGADCESSATSFGGCANCHAPGIDGALGGRNLLEARGFAYDYGVHCDVCHKVESVDLAAPEAGVAGVLRIHRPSEQGSISLGPWRPIQFGPNPDVPNVRMGNVPRDHFETSDLCAGCHELSQPVLVTGASIDAARWPSGRLPIHSTYSEWKASPLNPGAPCQSCHMPPDPDALNSADLQLFPDATIGLAGGWVRPPGAVRQHVWIGPRAEGSRMLENAAAVFVDKATTAGELTATVTVKNVGPGHAIPTGEPMRSIVLTVTAQCGAESLVAVGGDAVPDYGGAVAVQAASGDWTLWPGAAPGDRVRVVVRSGEFNDYNGFGSFGDGTFDAAAKGLPVEEVAGEATVTAVAPDGTVTLDAALPPGDVAYLVRGDNDFAGAAGAAFARVLVGPGGARMVPHHRAVDVASDNRLLPQQAWTTEHRFAATCAEPTVTARLLHLDVPAALARSKGWTRTARPMTEVTR